ncbi:hypothetical protein [Sphingomonas sp. PP-CE-3G-477]|uniref:hypothetical protein n=1 Tax=Sphingomonas sp. PP-CE-3G-477 TaxID=2135660 RepID=UPI0011B1E7A5|nr:hypothetical protein [Sphingomonas sp. PP-CE-3G-477]
MKSIIILFALIAAADSKAFAQSVSDTPIILGGDPLPAQLNAQYQVVCGKDRVFIQLHTDKGEPSILTDVIINGKNWVNDTYFAELKAFVSTIDFPYLSGASCPADQFSFIVSGRPRSGSDTFYRVTFPRMMPKTLVR